MLELAMREHSIVDRVHDLYPDLHGVMKSGSPPPCVTIQKISLDLDKDGATQATSVNVYPHSQEICVRVSSELDEEKSRYMTAGQIDESLNDVARGIGDAAKALGGDHYMVFCVDGPIRCDHVSKHLSISWEIVAFFC